MPSSYLGYKCVLFYSVLTRGQLASSDPVAHSAHCWSQLPCCWYTLFPCLVAKEVVLASGLALFGVCYWSNSGASLSSWLLEWDSLTLPLLGIMDYRPTVSSYMESLAYMVLPPRLNFGASSLTTSGPYIVSGQACWVSQHHTCPLRELMPYSVYHGAAAPGQISGGILRRFPQTLQHEIRWRLLLSMIS